jgi:predicted nuclease of predicted toxin-antitoxin system
MKLLIDQNLSSRLVKLLTEQFPDSKHLIDLKLDKASDFEVWEYAKSNNFIIISKDTDFININTLKGFPPKIICIQRGNCSTDQIFHLIIGNFLTIKFFIENPDKGILILR